MFLDILDGCSIHTIRLFKGIGYAYAYIRAVKSMLDAHFVYRD